MTRSAELHAPHRRIAGLACALSLATVSVAQAQMPEPRDYMTHGADAGEAASFVAELSANLAQRHGPLAEAIFAMNDELVRTPHVMAARPSGPVVPRVGRRAGASGLIHYQASQGGTLGRLHGSTRHGVGLGWFPHSMFAQSGRVFGQWGHARLLAAVQAFAAGDSD